MNDFLVLALASLTLRRTTFTLCDAYGATVFGGSVALIVQHAGLNVSYALLNVSGLPRVAHRARAGEGARASAR